MSRYVWLADRTGVAHAQPRMTTRTFCGRPALDARWAWPKRIKCAECRKWADKADQLEAQSKQAKR